MEEQKRVFTALGFEDYDWSETTSAWFVHNMDKLKTRKYNQGFTPQMGRVYDWVYEHRNIIWDTTLEEQEQMMIADGVLTPDDI